MGLIHRKFSECWHHRNWLTYCLAPMAGIYCLVAASRRFLYRQGVLKIHYFPLPVIVVGNITSGGTGKTPLVIYLANWLKQQGYRPGVVSRGYGGKAPHYPCQVHANSDPDQVGDEPVLIHQHTHCPTLVDPNRVRAVETLLKATDCNLVLSDDGMQHYALGRTLEIAVIDGHRRFGNQYHLPAGPLREPITRLHTVDFIFNHGEIPQAGEWSFSLLPDGLYSLVDPTQQRNVNDFNGQPIHAVAAIGHPMRFFNSLQALGLNVITHPFPDHHRFQPLDFNYGDNAAILVTEKDAAKCLKFADERFWCLRTKTQVEPNFHGQLLDALRCYTWNHWPHCHQ